MHKLIRNSRAEEDLIESKDVLDGNLEGKMHNVLPLLPFSFRTYPLLRNTTNEPNVNWTARWKHRFIESREKGLVREAATSNARPPNDLLALRCRRRKEDDERSARDYFVVRTKTFVDRLLEGRWTAPFLDSNISGNERWMNEWTNELTISYKFKDSSIRSIR